MTGNVSVGGTLTYEDVTNIDSVGIITARQGVRVNADSANPAGNSATNYISVGESQDLKLYHNGNQNFITAADGTLLIQADNIMLVSDDTAGRSLYQDNANSRLELGFDGTAAAYVSSSNVQFAKPITASTDSQHDIGTNSVRFRNAYVDTYYGSGANLTGIAVTEAPVVDYTITGSNPNYYFHGGGVDETDGNPDLYLIRGQKYRFNNTTGSGHPFRFTSTGNANAGYSNGVTGDEEGVQFWTIPYDAPAKLFYVCTIHNGMVGNIYIRGANGQNDNVGITTFTSRLEVKGGGGGTLKVTGSAAHTSKIVIADNSGTANGNCLVEGGDGSDFFTIQSSGNVLFENGKGINFGATEGSGATTSVLDDYEEGVFTPTLSGGTSDVNMHYTKIGRVVHITGSLAFSSVSGSGTMTMGGLPYTSINTLDSYTHLAAHAYVSLNVGNTTYQFQTLRVNQNSTNMVIVIPAGNGNVRTFGQYSHLSGSTFRFRVAGYYITA